MKQKFKLSLSACLPLNEGFSFDELVIETKRMFEEEGIAGFLKLVGSLLDMIVYPPLLGAWEKSAPHRCCANPHYVVGQKENKRLQTSVGCVDLLWTRIRCVNCGRSIVPLRGYLNLEPHQRKTNELERIVTEVVSEQSYRRSSQHLRTIGCIPVPHTTLHRWVMKSDCDYIPMKRRVDTIVADGTGYKMKPGDDGSNRGEVRVVVGITKEGKVVPFGAWSDESWRGIGTQIKKANHPSEKIKFTPIGELLVSDGEEGLIRGLKRLVNNTQRCIWHLPHDLGPILKYTDKADKEEAHAWKAELATILNFDLPKDDFQAVPSEERLEIEKRSWQAEREVQALIDELKSRGYRSAATYLENAKDKMFSYVRLWLKSGIVHPRVSSMVERMMREIGRRIKKIGFGWSPKGAEKLTRIIIKRITSANEWDLHWRVKLKLTGKVKLSFLDCELA